MKIIKQKSTCISGKMVVIFCAFSDTHSYIHTYIQWAWKGNSEQSILQSYSEIIVWLLLLIS